MKIAPFIFVLSVSFFWGCGEKADYSSSQENYFFHLKENEAYLPVWVRGNVASGKILLYIQGGPGLNTMDFATVDYAGWENTVEKDYAIAYYDQRGTGNAQGTFELESVSLAQYLKDIKKIVQVIQHHYPGAEIYLFGHSFGGWLAYLYTLEYPTDPLVEGIIAMNAPFTTDHNETRWTFRHQFLERVASDFVESGTNSDFWSQALAWAEANPSISDLEQKRAWNRWVIEGLGAYEVEPELRTGKVLKAIFASSLNVFPTLTAQDRLDKVSNLLFEDQQGINLLARLAEIKLPILMITGSYDDIAPAEELEFALGQLGSAEKQLVILPDAGHDSMINQPEQFRETIKQFFN